MSPLTGQPGQRFSCLKRGPRLRHAVQLRLCLVLSPNDISAADPRARIPCMFCSMSMLDLIYRGVSLEMRLGKGAADQPLREGTTKLSRRSHLPRSLILRSFLSRPCFLVPPAYLVILTTRLHCATPQVWHLADLHQPNSPGRESISTRLCESALEMSSNRDAVPSLVLDVDIPIVWCSPQGV